MRININKIKNVYESLSAENKKVQENKTGKKPGFADKVEISATAKDLEQSSSAVSKVLEDINRPVNPERLEKLKRDIAIGKYRKTSEDIAEAIMNTGYKKQK